MKKCLIPKLCQEGYEYQKPHIHCNGIINEAAKDKSKNLDIQIVDYKQCFGSMWLDEVINDLYETGIKDDNLNLLYRANEKDRVTVKTPVGETKEIYLKKSFYKERLLVVLSAVSRLILLDWNVW